MHIDSYFSLSNCDAEEAEYLIYGIPYDATQSFKPGSRFAPNAIREASWNLESYSNLFDVELSLVKVGDAGNINCDGGFEQIVERTKEFLGEVEGFPVAIGGEHSISFAATSKFRKACFVVFDAHFDLRDEFDGDRFNHACTTRRIFESGMRVAIFGVRSGIKEEKRFAEENGIKYLHAWDFEVEKAVKMVEDFDKIYVSLDVDAFDPAFAPGVSTPEPFGLKPIDFIRFFAGIADRVVGFDVVEVVPDSNKVTQTLAAKIILEAIAAKVRCDIPK
ncbi:agmatinase [Archaeoglobus fulgidus]|jgi:agmatinase|uniref:Agmatinase (SpeB) n=3 Tax=Archaeoglobus fulgidus TaxID=2234 RepID=O29611_ARCFU|nr:agmatinase [Archaeoglobus fulgidus]AAB90592.1 agmatinase (speB) [Archaeoglobus fulgidus DSM 4304]AIG97525.1 agmatinase [Archaeoglobus fulgidus DSM 8774]KUJ93446.1 MAG: Agmatinase (SpeB) [Archaeoglobus fulgidus]KUK07077.1 MAG: Agmatinase (SpeB) [Archaeoglobus fulgidus]